MNILFETERTIIRPLVPADAAGLFLLDSNPNVHRFVGQQPLTEPEAAAKVISIIRQQYEDFGIGRWAMLEKNTGDFIGWIGFKYMTETVNKHTGHYDFGYRFREEFWGKGYATEGGKACLKHGMEQLKLQNIYAMTHIDNLASRRVLEKCGFTLIEIFGCDAAPNWQEANEPTTWYAYTASIQ